MVTGEKFADVRDLKKVLRRDRKTDIYQCLTEKMLTYALGRGLEYYDMPAVRKIVRDAQPGGLKLSALIAGIAKSVPFQMRRTPEGLKESSR